KIPLKKLKEGDTVIGEFKKLNLQNKLLDAISKEEINQLIKAYGENYEVEVKDMVRYAPSFLLAYLLTLTIGDKIVWLLVK
ncbi:MAG: hypothetical protein GXN99_00610, partial [Candidatus Nanohaloarchaeota archaeon]|nr:hypothetical protein [Candidatus Nanohaloarchaeota archaeon]